MRQFMRPEPDASLSPEFERRLRRLDYRGVAGAARDAATDGDRYLAVRAHLILGDYTAAAALLDDWATAFADDGFLLPFLRLQLRLYRREALIELVSELCRLRAIPG